MLSSKLFAEQRSNFAVISVRVIVILFKLCQCQVIPLKDAVLKLQGEPHSMSVIRT